MTRSRRYTPPDPGSDDQTATFVTFVSGCIDSVQPAVNEVMAVINDMRCMTGVEFDVEVALLEALANAVEHGCKGDPCKQVQVLVTCHPERGLMIVISDPGEGFDPASLPDATGGDRLLATGGRGIFLINQLMDEVSYERGGTVIRMRKGRQPPTQPSP